MDGIVECSDCTVGLVDQLPSVEVDDGTNDYFIAVENFKTIYEDDNSVNAQMVLKLLESNGFTCKVIGANEVRYPPTQIVAVQVEESELEDAKAVIEAYKNTQTTEFDVEQ